MRAKIALIVVLASFLALSALGVGMAGADPLGRAAPTHPAHDHDRGPLAAGTGLRQRARRRRRRPGRPRRPRLHRPRGHQRGDRTGRHRRRRARPRRRRRPHRRRRPRTSGAEQGASIGGDDDEAQASTAGSTATRALATPAAAAATAAAVNAPSATGGGDQPLADGADGGSQFGAGGTPTTANPTTTIAPFGPAPIGVPNFVIDSFEIPPFLLPIYQACGTEYGIPWEVLASINKIETGFGTNLNVSSAGAVGWMQFLPSSWEAYGVDANGDGRKDPYNPVDAICAAANYLKIAGGNEDLYDAIFAYNHADWYVQEVLLYARAYGKLPSDLVGSLTGLTEGAHFPVAADARYADDISARAALKSSNAESRVYGNAAEVISSSPTRRGINIFSARGRPGRRRQRRRRSASSAARRSSASSSSSKTPTATATPTPSSARSSATSAWS